MATFCMSPFVVTFLSLTPLASPWVALPILLRRLPRGCFPLLLKIFSSHPRLYLFPWRIFNTKYFVSCFLLLFVCVLFIPLLSLARCAPLPREKKGYWHVCSCEDPVVPNFCRVLRSLLSSACVASREPRVLGVCGSWDIQLSPFALPLLQFP